MNTADLVTHAPSVKHVSRNDPYLLRVVNSYLPTCPCGWKSRVTADERAAKGAAARHGRGL